MILERIEKENDIKKLSEEELKILADEIRAFLIQKISETGGHLASNLGVVELRWRSIYRLICQRTS